MAENGEPRCTLGECSKGQGLHLILSFFLATGEQQVELSRFLPRNMQAKREEISCRLVVKGRKKSISLRSSLEISPCLKKEELLQQKKNHEEQSIRYQVWQ